MLLLIKTAMVYQKRYQSGQYGGISTTQAIPLLHRQLKNYSVIIVSNFADCKNCHLIFPIISSYQYFSLYKVDCGAMLYGYADDDDIDQYSPTPIWTLRQWWSTMNDKYRKEVNLVPLYPDISQIVVPVHIGDAGEKKGRAIFATEQIKEGTLVKDLLNGSTAIFKDAHTWRKFVLSLPREMACNHLEWNWVQYIQPEKEDDIDLWEGLSVFIAFDESSLLNAGDWNKWRDDSNVRCGSPPMHDGGERGPCRFHYYASRDIAAGEELLIKYNDFEDESQEGWKDIGL